MILLDTNIVLFYFKGMDAVVRRFQLTPRRDLRIPSVAAYELAYGTMKIRSSRRLILTNDFLGSSGTDSI